MIISIYSNIGNNKGQDTEDQLAELRHYAGSQQREVYLFVDREAGKTGHRAAFQNLFQSAARREFQVVLVWALDRFIGESVAEVFVGLGPSWAGDFGNPRYCSKLLKSVTGRAGAASGLRI
jgi:hypothetical protein